LHVGGAASRAKLVLVKATVIAASPYSHWLLTRVPGQMAEGDRGGGPAGQVLENARYLRAEANAYGQFEATEVKTVRKKASRITLNRETLRRLDPEYLEKALAAGIATAQCGLTR
jgi:hypothetical protein